MTLFIGILFILAGFLLGFGDNGRGTHSRYISILAGLIWLAGLIISFFYRGLVFSLFALIASFVIANIMQRLGKHVVISMRSK